MDGASNESSAVVSISTFRFSAPSLPPTYATRIISKLHLACILETVASAPFLPAEIDVNDRDSSSNPIQSD